MRRLSPYVDSLLANIERVVLGKRNVARDCLIALFAGEHVLLEDVPGVGKTLMGKAIAKSVDGSFHRVQFTPDLLPSDIVGSSIFNSHTNEFEFNAGPIFCNFVLADEINRAPPRTQSALLEAMSDNQVSIDGKTRALPDPFMVIATQNPFEFEGTYVLPESQLDRFLFRLSMGYPDRNFEQQILADHRSGEPVEELTAVCDQNTLSEIKQAIRNIRMDETISSYILDIVEATRQSSNLSVGASTRGALLWYRAAQASAFIAGRDFVIPDDAKDLAVKVLAHRVKTVGAMGSMNRQEVEAVILEIISSVPVP
ncbi:MAG: MoxR family ATPase [Planctomycetota bacterium]